MSKSDGSEYRECAKCSDHPGVAITLCEVCIHNRNLVASLKREVAGLERMLGNANQKISNLESEVGTWKHSSSTFEQSLTIANQHLERAMGLGRLRLWQGSKACVRIAPDGKVWLLNRPDRGWGEFGYTHKDWADLMLRWDIVVVGICADQHGAYMLVQSAPLADIQSAR